LLVAIISTAPAAGKDSPYYRWIAYDPPKPAPAGLMEMKGGERSLADFKGQAVLLNLWATWCVPCLKELPTLDRLEHEWAEKGLVVLPLSLDTQPYEKVRAFLDTSKLDLPHLAIDRGDISESLQGNALPITFLINRDGKIIAHFAGATNWNDKQHEKYLNKALEGEGR